jgi:glyoxylase-like metal-dependent hydrolase (beta-lactamase superfamily II)
VFPRQPVAARYRGDVTKLVSSTGLCPISLKNGKSVILDKDEYDVFGDGQVVIKSAPGHTPGHQVLVLRLASTGRVMLSGDLYHYPPERTLHRAPPDNEFNVEQSAASRTMIEEYLRTTKTTLWIEHDFVSNPGSRNRPPITNNGKTN